jgi:hypothetical protein
VGYKFSLVLSREVTDDESAILRDAGCKGAVFETDTLPTNAEVTVTKMDFDDTVSPSLADAIQSALDAVKSVPELSVPGLTVPAQPAGPAAEEPDKVIKGVVVENAATDEKPAAKKPAAKKPAAKKTSTRRTTAKAANGNGASAPDGSGPADNAAEPVGTAAGSD